jgi:nicotinamide-nucleotide amidase
VKRPEEILVNYLKEHKLTIALAESVTCGLATHKLGSIIGTSEVLMGSIICYSQDVKIGLLEIKRTLIETHTAESLIVTNELAKQLGKIIKADIHAAITGLASPGGSETKSKPVGTVFFSFLYKRKMHKMEKRFSGSPPEIKEKACDQLFKFITATLKQNG